MQANLKLGTCLTALALTGACGKAAKDPDFSHIMMPADGSNIAGVYVADMHPLNEQYSSVQGSAALFRKQDHITAMVRIKNGTPNSWHPQKVYLGNRCPTSKDDLNGDGLIDYSEGEAVWGKAIIPLDNDLGSQDAGKDQFPSSNHAGEYQYKRTASFTGLFSDLKELDTDFQDDTAKLIPSGGLALEGRVIVVMGADKYTNVPESVARNGSWSRHASLPVACGIFRKVNSLPAEEVEESSSQPTPEPTDDPTTAPAPTPVPDSGSAPRPRPSPPRHSPDNDRDSDTWVDRILDWWRERWRDWTD